MYGVECMVAEHDLWRLYLSELEASLDRYQTDPSTLNKLGILSGAISYAGLLRRHIEKENQVVYPFAERSLPETVLQSIDVRVPAFEADPARESARNTALRILQVLVEKYPTE